MISIFKHLLKLMLRRKGLVISTLIFPFICIILMYGFISSSGDTAVKIGIVDNDNTKQSEYILKSLQKNKRYEFYNNLNDDELNYYIENQKLEAIVKIDKDFGSSIIMGEPKKIELMYNNTSEATAWLKNDINYLIDRLQLVGKASQGDETIYEDILSKSENEEFVVNQYDIEDESIGISVVLRAVGLLVVLMITSTSILVEQILADKYSGITGKIKLAASNYWGYLASMALIGLIIVAVQTILIQIGIIVMGIKMGIPIIHYMLSIFSFGIYSVGLAIFIGAICKNNITAQSLTNILNIPFAMLAGCFWPLSLMPEYMQKIGKFIPQNWTLSAISAIQNNDNYGDYYSYILRLLILSILLLVAGAIIMNKKLDSMR